MAVLSDAEIDAALVDLDGWSHAEGALRRSVDFADFPAGIAAVTRVAELAEAADHHPDIDIRWRTVVFVLRTHSEGGVTGKDVALARQIDAVVANR